MFPTDEIRLRVDDANDLREWLARWWWPLQPEAPEGLPPLGPVVPPLDVQRRMHRKLLEDIARDRQARWDWKVNSE